MRLDTIPYNQFTFISAMPQHHSVPSPTKPIEILPASLLGQKASWRAISQALPTNTCLLVSSLDHPLPNALMLRLSQLFQRKGTQVFVLSIGQ